MRAYSIIGIINIVLGIIGAIIAFFIFTLSPQAEPYVGLTILFAFFVFIVSIAGIIGGAKILQNKNYARIILIFVWIVYLFYFLLSFTGVVLIDNPYGVFIYLYLGIGLIITIWVLYYLSFSNSLKKLMIK